MEFEILELPQILSSKKTAMTIPHRAQFYHILWIEKGFGTHMVDFKPIKMEDHTVIFIPQNCVNLFDPKGSYQGKVILFTDHFFSQNEEDHRFLASSILFSDLYTTAQINWNTPSSRLKMYLQAMEDECSTNYDNGQPQILHNLLHIFLLQAEREIRKQGFSELKPCPDLDYLIEFKEVLEQTFRIEKSVKKYALKMGLSEKHLNKITKAFLDKTPKQIIDERVILEAKRLLIHTNLSVKEIAYQTGFEDPTNFVKYFKKHTSHTPVRFREQF
ncbi:AraC family transcriptional regulator [Thermophagus sp. OGC60D27]|uniref:AraC family transcriptional regulator n=1 Tax=Thermophagus sp. OGC60D27 TaxID=3458415 RepID=UPI0040377BAA